MNVEKVNETFITREWRGEAVFACHWSGYGFPNWFSPEGKNWSNFSNSWLDVPVPVPLSAKSVLLFGMFVGGVLPGQPTFMMDLDFADPVPTWALPNGGDWSANGDQGDFYYDFTTVGARCSFGVIPVPCRDSKIKLRWRCKNSYDSAWGINIWCQGYMT
jgi:hypothetical protein